MFWEGQSEFQNIKKSLVLSEISWYLALVLVCLPIWAILSGDSRTALLNSLFKR